MKRDHVIEVLAHAAFHRFDHRLQFSPLGRVERGDQASCCLAYLGYFGEAARLSGCPGFEEARQLHHLLG